MPKAKKKTAERPINIRKAHAGVYLMKGAALGEALVRAGFSPKTANNATANGLGVEQCLIEAKRLDPEATPQSLLRRARRVQASALRRLEALQPGDWDFKMLAVGVKWSELAEKYHDTGPSGRDARDIRTFVQRMTMLSEILNQAKKRGLIASENVDSHESTPAKLVGSASSEPTKDDNAQRVDAPVDVDTDPA